MTEQARKIRLAEYAKQRYENNPEKHESDKARYRQYMLKRRQDPEYRRMENERRRLRRQLQRQAADSSGTEPTTRRRKTQTLKDEDSSKSGNELEISSAPNSELGTYEVDDNNSHSNYTIALEHTVDLDESNQGTGFNITFVGETDEEDNGHDNNDTRTAKDNKAKAATNSLIGKEENQQEQMESKSPRKSTRSQTKITIQPPPPPPETITAPSSPEACACSHSNALKKLADLSKDLAPMERRRLESGLLQFAEDFMETPPDDMFTLLICNKLKRVSKELRPDLEVDILKAINDTLKQSK